MRGGGDRVNIVSLRRNRRHKIIEIDRKARTVSAAGCGGIVTVAHRSYNGVLAARVREEVYSGHGTIPHVTHGRHRGQSMIQHVGRLMGR